MSKTGLTKEQVSWSPKSKQPGAITSTQVSGYIRHATTGKSQGKNSANSTSIFEPMDSSFKPPSSFLMSPTPREKLLKRSHVPTTTRTILILSTYGLKDSS